MDRKQWFIDRIGKLVFRSYQCGCEFCSKIYNEGTIIHNIGYALDMYENETLFQLEGTKLKYFDTKEERTKYETENNLKP